MSAEQPYVIYGPAESANCVFVVGWSGDAGRLGSRVVDYLNRKLGGKQFGEIERTSFFALNGVSVINDVARFPDSRFFRCEQGGLVTLRSSQPQFDWYAFLNAILDVAQYHCHAVEIYSVGAMVTLSPHTVPRQLLATANSPEMRRVLSDYDLARTLNYETPPGQRPTLSSYLLWVARRRGLDGANLWVPVPFYLATREDPRAWKKIVEFLDMRFGWGLDFSDLNQEAAELDVKIASLRSQSPEINDCLQKLESNITLNQEESERLVRGIADALPREY